MTTKYNFAEFKFNETSEYNRLNKCLNIIRRDERISAEFKNKGNQKFNGRPVVIERNGQYCVFVHSFSNALRYAGKGKWKETSIVKEYAYYAPVCRTIETIKKEKAYKY